MSQSSSFAAGRYLPIKELTTWTPRWVILGRVLDKGPINSFKRHDGAASKVGSVDIMDQDGDSIRAKFWGDAADKWISFLEQGKVYSFSGGRVQVANKRFNNLNHSYELTFDVDAKITAVNPSDTADISGQSIPYLRKFNFTTLRDVHNSPRELPFLVDLLVVLKWISPTVEHFTSRTTQDAGVRCLAHVVDDTGFQMALTLFGEHAEQQKDGASGSGLQPGAILAIQNVQIREFRGRNGSTLRSTHIVVNPDISEAEPLRAWLHSCDIHSETFKMLSEGPTMTATSSMGTRGSDSQTGDNVVLKDVVAALQGMSAVTTTTPIGQADPTSELFVVAPVEPTKLLYVNRTGEVTLFYPACPKCNRKVSRFDDVGAFRCEACGIEREEPNYRFMFAMHLVDSSGGRFTARTFHDAGAVIVGSDAQKLAQLVPPRSIAADMPAEAREILEYNSLWKKYRIGLRARREFFGGEERTTVSVVFAEPFDYVSHGKRLLTEIQQLLSNASSLPDSRKRPPESLNDDVVEGNDVDSHCNHTKKGKLND